MNDNTFIIETMKKNTKTNRLFEYCDTLPDCCQSFLLETGTETANTTRLAYARELSWFFDYLISYSPDFCDLKKKDIELKDIKKITSQDISRYLTIYKDEGHKERTIARKRAALSSFFGYLTKNKQIDYNPVLASVRVKIHQSDEVIHIDMDEQIKLLKSVFSGDDLDPKKQKYHNRYKERDYALLLLLLDTGIRVSELNQINVGDVDFEDCSVIILRKGGNTQTVYFSNETKEAIEDYLSVRKEKDFAITNSDPLFVTLKGDRLSIRAIEELVKKYTSSSLPGIGNKLSPHKMRASFAMAFYEEEKDILALQRKLGHKNLTATNIYAKATDKKMKETRSVLEKKRASLQ